METKIRPIRTEADYENALEAILPLMDAEPGTEGADDLEVLSRLIEAYEDEHYKIEAPNPIEAIKFHMEQRGLERKDFALIVGQNRATELLGRQRKLTLGNIRAIHNLWKMPIEALIGDYRLENRN